MNKNFVVPKIPVELQILREGASGFHPCRLFLSSLSPHHYGPESIVEFLNNEVNFVPVELDGKIHILNLHQIMVFRDISGKFEGFGKTVKLTLKNTRLFMVRQAEELPESHCRTQDYLNNKGLFVEFISDETRIFVNKSFIVSAVDQ